MSQRWRPYACAQRGFTLLELVIVCVLISISLALAVPTLRNSLVGDQLAAGSRKVISLVKSARSRAARDGVAQRLYFDPATREIWYQPAVEAEEREEEKDKELERQGHSAVTLPEEIRIEEIRQAGGPDDSNPFTDGLWISKQGYMDRTFIRLGDADNETIYLLIQPYLFDIQVVEEFSGFD